MWAGGNLGASPLDVLDDLGAEDLVLLELSNYQLEFLDESPWIAAVTNIAPDHLVDYDGDYRAYKAAKRRIIDFQSERDWAVLNYDDAVTRAWLAVCQGRPFPFSRQAVLTRGTFVRSDTIVVRRDEGEAAICRTGALKARGAHNVENALCAATIGVLAGIPAGDIGGALVEYTPGEHRLEFVGEWHGIQFYNDSKSTTPSSTLAAVRAFPGRPLLLLAGGRDKGLPWDELAAAVHESCREVILFGESRAVVEQALLAQEREQPAGLTIKSFATLEEAVEAAIGDARSGDVVLLSPACTSFDAFDNYAERGRLFKRLVRDAMAA